MKILFFIFLFYHVWAAYRIPVNKLDFRALTTPCDNCLRGPIYLERNFSVHEENFDQVTISSNGKIINENSSDISILTIINQTEFSGHLYHDIIEKPYKLEWTSRHIRKLAGYESFNATWAFSVFWDRIGSLYEYKRNTYQLLFVTDEKTNFIIFNYKNRIFN